MKNECLWCGGGVRPGFTAPEARCICQRVDEEKIKDIAEMGRMLFPHVASSLTVRIAFDPNRVGEERTDGKLWFGWAFQLKMSSETSREPEFNSWQEMYLHYFRKITDLISEKEQAFLNAKKSLERFAVPGGKKE